MVSRFKKCIKWEGVVRVKVLSEREFGFFGNFGNLIGISVRGVMGEWEMGCS